MTGRLFVDGVDVYAQHGVYITAGGYNGLVAFPPLKSVVSNDWQEEDGAEVDLSAPVLNTKEVQITFAFGGLFARFCDFLTLLSDGAYHDFNCAYIGRTYKLRLTQQPNLDIVRTLGTATLKFADDFPLSGYIYNSPQSGVVQSDAYQLDGLNLTQYGCHILQGTLAEVMKSAQVKPNLLRNIPTKSGAIYDPQTVTYKTKEVKLKCLCRADTLSELWRNYDALLYNLTLPDGHVLTVAELEQDFPFYYKSCSVSDFYPDGKIWLAFTLTLVFTGSFRLDGSDFVLSTEGGVVVSTEDAEQNAVNMYPNRENQ